MRSVLVKIPFWLPFAGWFEIPIFAYGTLLVFGLFAGLFLARRLFQAEGARITANQIIDMVFVAVLAGVVGSRILYMIQYRTSFNEFFKVWEGGLVFQGGVAGGTLGVIWFLKRHKLPVLKTGDVIMPCLLLGLAWGRLGCFMNGCCFGKPAPNLAWAISFPEGSPAIIQHQELFPEEVGKDSPCSLPVHPTQIYSSLSAAGLGLGLTWLLARKRFDGQVIAVASMAYGVMRIVLEFFRGDIDPVVHGLTQAQLISAGMFFMGAVLYGVWRRQAAR